MTGWLVNAQGLLVPADMRRRVERKDVPLTSAAMSDLIGGGLLEEAYASLHDQGFVMYLDESVTLKWPHPDGLIWPHGIGVMRVV